MQIRVGFEIGYECPVPTPMLLSLSIHHAHVGQLIRADHLVTEPSVPISGYRDLYGNWCSRIVAPAGRIILRSDALLSDTGVPDPVDRNAQQVPAELLPDSTLLYLLGSRYCETDQLGDIAWARFGCIEGGWARVQAICDFVQQHISFGYEHASHTRTALESYRVRRGVCRDYAHLAIALCRAMNIPARYCTGYLGDIGVEPPYGPMDFAAWFEAWIGDRWVRFDPRNNVPRIGYVLLARGRDACDVALSNSFGSTRLVRFEVRTDEVVAT